jgi:hypothetical protein
MFLLNFNFITDHLLPYSDLLQSEIGNLLHMFEWYPALFFIISIKTYGVVKVQSHTFLTLALDGGDWSASCPYYFIPGE